MSMPPSSPRLPSPPPAAEIQIGPASPSGNHGANRQPSQIEQTILEANSKRRVHRGTKAADMAAGPPLMPLSELDSAFELQEHLSALHYHHTKGRTQPITRATAEILAAPPSSADRTLWLYELCRFLISQCNGLIVGFLFDNPPCSSSTCPEMRASEWQFLCAVHEQPKSCCAIDYCCHTLDWAANVVTDQKIFPSRFVALSDSHNKNAAMKNLVNVFRRLHRIFAHAWFQHRTVFWSVEKATGLYVFFKRVCDTYDLLPGETFKLPPEAEGLDAEKPAPPEPTSDKQAATSGLAPPGNFERGQGAQMSEGTPRTDDDHGVGRTNTRRHIRSSPSTGSAVTTVIEADEDEGAELAARTRALHISSAAAAGPVLEEEPEAEEVPVIVEDSMMQDAAQPNESPVTENETPTAATVELSTTLGKPDESKEGAPATAPVETEEPSGEAALAQPQEQQISSNEAEPEAQPSFSASEEGPGKQKESSSTDTVEVEGALADATVLAEDDTAPTQEKASTATVESNVSVAVEDSTEPTEKPFEKKEDASETPEKKEAEEKGE
ncbi:hypothetical protein jhhlp_003690 [Lomentospora prolificans]|uniref:Mob1/phocein n=1 Tax=Lomentospora prolificans TaxID=41688 RepID=A0A2N3N9F4_9PEZI|nr:hypothetical protein jhhlp_003690 [Lomentospora prolificans]